MRSPRLTVRRMMVAVAVAGALAWAVEMRSRSAEFLARAGEDDRLAGLSEDWAAGFVLNSPKLSPEESADLARGVGLTAEEFAGRMRAGREAEGHYLRLARHYAGLGAKYRRAARSPWLPVEPDPPSPEWGEINPG